MRVHDSLVRRAADVSVLLREVNAASARDARFLKSGHPEAYFERVFPRRDVWNGTWNFWQRMVADT